MEDTWCNYSDLPSPLSYIKQKPNKMKFEDFNLLVNLLKKQSDRYGILRDNGVDLLEYDDPKDRMIEILFKEIYGEEGLDWFYWFCHENDFGEKKLGAWDENKNEICQDVESLWKFLEMNRTT